MIPNYLIDQGNGFEWLPFNSFEDVVEALSGLEPFKVYEVERGEYGKLILFNISVKAATVWVAKNESSIEIEDGEPLVCAFIKNNASNLDELVGEFVTSQMARERDERALMAERL